MSIHAQAIDYYQQIVDHMEKIINLIESGTARPHAFEDGRIKDISARTVAELHASIAEHKKQLG